MESTLPLGCGDARYVILFSCSLSPMPLPSGNIVAGGPLPRSPFFSLLVSSFSSSVSSSFQICCSRRRSSCAFSSAFIACILLRRERAAALSALCSSVSLALQPANAARKRAVLSMSCCSPAPPDVAGSSPAVILFCCSPAPPDVAGALSAACFVPGSSSDFAALVDMLGENGCLSRTPLSTRPSLFGPASWRRDGRAGFTRGTLCMAAGRPR
jgi:hypothetical protein